MNETESDIKQVNNKRSEEILRHVVHRSTLDSAYLNELARLNCPNVYRMRQQFDEYIEELIATIDDLTRR